MPSDPVLDTHRTTNEEITNEKVTLIQCGDDRHGWHCDGGLPGRYRV